MSPGNATILVVDDDRDFRRAVCTIIMAAGYKALEESHAGAVLTVIREQKPDLVLLDLNLPGGKVSDLIQSMNESKLCTPVVILSGYIEADLYQALRRLGIQDFLAKPFAGGELTDRIEKVLLRKGGKNIESDI